MVALDLTREAHARKPFLRKPRLLGLCHASRFAFHELDTTCRAPGVSAARVENVDAGILLDRENEPLAVLHIHGAESLNCQTWHEGYVNVSVLTDA